MLDLNQYYLQTMGIDRWLVRDNGSCKKKLEELAKKVASCTDCLLHKTRSNTVFARGNFQAKLMIMGEAPGFYEDKQGLPFVGKAGQLLNSMLQSIGMSEDDIYIANVIKCRPPDNRNPTVEEVAKCSHYLSEQIELVKPSLLLALGRFAGEFLLKRVAPIHQLRQTIFHYEGIPAMVTYHPAYLLRNPKDKSKAYADLLFTKQNLIELCKK